MSAIFTPEFLKEHGFVDQIISIDKIKDTIHSLVKFFKSEREYENEA